MSPRLIKKVMPNTVEKINLSGSTHRQKCSNSISSFEQVSNNLTHYDKYLKNEIWSGKTVPLTTGIPSLDRYLTSFPDDGGLIVLGARTSMGKTALALNIAHNIASTNKPVIFISLEMSVKYQLFDRLHSLVTKLKLVDIKRVNPPQEIADKIAEAKRKLKEIPLFTAEGGKSPSVDGIEFQLQKFLAHCEKNNLDKPKLIVVDHLGYLREFNERSISVNTTASVSSITRDLCILSKTFRIPILLLSQLSRNLEYRDNKSPRLSDLRDSGAIEQDADIVLLMHRPIYHQVSRCIAITSNCSIKDKIKSLEPIRTLACLFVAKNRSGRTGRINIAFDADYMGFREATEQERQDWHEYGI